MQDKQLLEDYIALIQLEESLQKKKEELREKIYSAFPTGYSDDRINIHFKNTEEWEFSPDYQHSEKTIKELKKALSALEKKEKTSGIAKVINIKQTLTITVK